MYNYGISLKLTTETHGHLIGHQIIVPRNKLIPVCLCVCARVRACARVCVFCSFSLTADGSLSNYEVVIFFII